MIEGQRSMAGQMQSILYIHPSIQQHRVSKEDIEKHTGYA